MLSRSDGSRPDSTFHETRVLWVGVDLQQEFVRLSSKYVAGFCSVGCLQTFRTLLLFETGYRSTLESVVATNAIFCQNVTPHIRLSCPCQSHSHMGCEAYTEHTPLKRHTQLKKWKSKQYSMINISASVVRLSSYNFIICHCTSFMFFVSVFH